MSSLVLELQADALNSAISTLELLRKAFVVAKKLNIKDFEKWIELELNGYESEDLLPKYRSIRGLLRAWNPYHGWQPIASTDQEINDLFSKICDCPIQQPISELVTLVNGENDLKMQLPFQSEARLTSFLGTEVRLTIRRSGVQAIVDAVRDIILSWALQLEEDGILGEGMTFSRDEKQIAAQHDYSRLTQVFYIGQTQMQQSSSESQSSSETFNNDLREANVANFANQVTDNARQQANQYNYASDQKQNLTEAAAEIQSLLNQLSQTYSTETVPGRMQLATEAITRIESNPNLMQRVLSALQAGGVSAIEELLSHPASSFVIAALEDWQKTKGV